MSIDIHHKELLAKELEQARLRVAELERELNVLPPAPLSGGQPSSFVICGLDAEGRYLFVDSHAARNLGAPPEQIVGRTVYDFFPRHDAEEYARRVAAVVRDGRARFFEDLARLPIGNRWFSSVIHPLYDAGGCLVGVQAISHDITERKEAEAAIEERLQFEELIANLASSFVRVHGTEVDQVTAEALQAIGEFIGVDRSLIYWFSSDNERLECIHHWHAAGLPELPERLHVQRRGDFPWLFQQMIEGRPVVAASRDDLPREAAEWQAMADQRLQSFLALPMRVAGRTLGAFCFGTVQHAEQWPQPLVARLTLVGDIIANALERVRAEEELRESRQFTNAVTESTPYIVFIFDLIEQAVTYTNQQVRHYLGYMPLEVQQLGGDIIAHMMHPEDRELYQQLLVEWRQASDSDYLESEFRLQRKDEQWRWFRFCGKVFNRGAAGEVRQLIVIGQDVTDRKVAEEELQSHRERLAHVSRLSTMGEMVAGIAHEMNQPLYAILNYAKACRNVLTGSRQFQPDEVLEWLSRIQKSATQAGEIMKRLRNFARHSVHRRERELLAEIVDEALQLVQFESRHRKVKLEVEGCDAFVKVDRVQIQQVLVNLLQNSLEAMKDIPAEQQRIEIRAQRQGEWLEVTVTDYGPGLPPGGIAIFEPFVTTRPGGMGMGLAISKTIVEEHGGKLAAVTAAGCGACISFSLPVDQENGA